MRHQSQAVARMRPIWPRSRKVQKNAKLSAPLTVPLSKPVQQPLKKQFLPCLYLTQIQPWYLTRIMSQGQAAAEQKNPPAEPASRKSQKDANLFSLFWLRQMSLSAYSQAVKAHTLPRTYLQAAIYRCQQSGLNQPRLICLMRILREPLPQLQVESRQDLEPSSVLSSCLSMRANSTGQVTKAVSRPETAPNRAAQPSPNPPAISPFWLVVCSLLNLQSFKF